MKADELIVDNFAGGGGASKGIEQALGRPVDIAINHDAIAVAMHHANHPATKHFCENVWDVNPTEACAGRPVGLAWFSPDCKHFSKAKGGKPVEKKIRGLAWVVLRWAAKVRPRIIMLENVEEFITWGPLVKDENGNHFPCPKRKGRTFKTFINALNRHGYAVEYRELRACDYGAPTIRKRLFLVARCDGQPIVWPQPTHGDPKSEAVKSGRLLPWKTAAECIEWPIPCPSIFERKRELAEATQRRIAKGIKKYVIEASEPFIVTYYGDKAQEFRGQGVGEPLRTQTTENRHALVMPYITEHANASSPRSMSIAEPLRTVCAQTKGGHFALVAPHIMPLTHQGSDRTNDIQEPLPTVTAAHRGEHALIASHMIRTDMHKSNAGCAYDAKDPLRTVTSGGGHALVSSTLIQTGYGERDGQSPRVPGIEKPLGTVVAGGIKHAVVSAFLAQHNGGFYDGAGRAADEPLSTIVQRGTQQGLVTANLVSHFGTGSALPIEEPLRTVTAKDKYSLCTSHLLNCKDGQPVTKPMPTITASGLHIGEVRAFLMKYYGNEKEGIGLRAPLHTVTTKDRFGLVTVHGEEYQIVDIGMRMLSPRELFRAQGFPDSYIIDRDITGKPINKTHQVAKCGNSVCPDLAKALVTANTSEAAAQYPAAEAM